MEDYYRNGFDFGYGKKASSGHLPGDYPQTDMDKKSYGRGIEDGIKRRFIADELDEEH